MRRGVIAAVGAAAILAGGAGVAMAAYDGSRRDLIAPGVQVGGVPVGGLRAEQARKRLARVLHGRARRPVVVRAGDRRFRLTAGRARARLDLDGLVARAVAASRRGTVLTRTLHGLTGANVDENLPLRATYSTAAVERFVRRIAAAVNRPPRNARLRVTAAGLRVRHSRAGARLIAAPLRHAVAAALARPAARHRLAARVQRLAPKLTTRHLAWRYPAYIVVSGSRVRLYRRLVLSRIFPLALPIPPGRYEVRHGTCLGRNGAPGCRARLPAAVRAPVHTPVYAG